MKNLATGTKIEKILEKTLSKKIAELKEYLMLGDFLLYEKELRNYTDGLYNKISECLLKEASVELLGKLKDGAKQENLKKLREREMNIQVATGHVVRL